MNGPPPSGRAAGRGRTVGRVTWRRGLIGAAAVLSTVAVVLAVRALGVPDVRTTDDLDLPTPELRGGHAETVVELVGPVERGAELVDGRAGNVDVTEAFTVVV